MEWGWIIAGLVVGALVGGVLHWARRDHRDEYDVDLLVVGGGAAGLTAAGMAARLGARAVLIERAKLGGDCTWYGCVPSKALLAAASVVHQARRADAFGLKPAELEVDLGSVLARVHALQHEIYEEADSPEVMEGYGVRCEAGSASFTGPHQVTITREDGEAETLSFRWCVLATGTEPHWPEVPGLAEAEPLTNETIFSLTSVPPRLAIVGGGPVGVELGQAFQRLGSKVTIITRGAHLLGRDDPALVATLESTLAKEGITLLCGSTLTRVERMGDELALHVDGPAGPVRRVADRVLVAAGRRPRLEGLGLHNLGVAVQAEGITVDERGCTSAPHVYASGDVAVGPNFTHWAEHASKVAVTNTVLGVPARLRPEALVWTTYTDPEVAHCGVAFDALDEHTKVYRLPYGKIDRALTERRGEGMVHVYARGSTIVGASAVGHLAGEIVGELSLAMQNGISMRKLADSMHGYPSWTLGARRAADQWYIQNIPVELLRALGRLRGLRGSVPDVDPDEVV